MSELTTPTLSTGQPSTLGVWRDLTAALFGGTSAAVAFLDAKIAEQGRDEPVLADEGQMLYLLTEIHSAWRQLSAQLFRMEKRIAELEVCPTEEA